MSQTKSGGRFRMNELAFFVLFIVVYFGLQFYVLPKLGVPT